MKKQEYTGALWLVHRRSLLQGEEPHQEGEGENPPSTLRSHRGSASSGQRGGRPGLFRGLRLQDTSGPLILKIALGEIAAAAMEDALAQFLARTLALWQYWC
jgi:hypothetical protein